MEFIIKPDEKAYDKFVESVVKSPFILFDMVTGKIIASSDGRPFNFTGIHTPPNSPNNV